MTENEAFSAMAIAFSTAWNNETHIVWPDDHYTVVANQEYVRFNPISSFGTQQSLSEKNNRKFRYEGILIIQIFTPAGLKGTRNRLLARKALDIFEGEHIDGIWFRNGTPQTIGNTDDDFYQTNVSIEFIYDHTR